MPDFDTSGFPTSEFPDDFKVCRGLSLQMILKKDARKQKSAPQVAELQAEDGSHSVIVNQGRSQVELRVPDKTTILQVKQMVCDGRARSFKGVLEPGRIALYNGYTELLDDHELSADVSLRMYLKTVARGEKRAADAELDAAEPIVKEEVLSGQALLEHVVKGGSLRNSKEVFNAEGLVMSLYKRLERGGDSSLEGHKTLMQKAIREWRNESGPSFVKEQQTRTTRNIKTQHALGRELARWWRKVEVNFQDQVGATDACLERELLGTGERLPKRFKTLLAKPVPGPIALDADDEEGEGDAK